MTTADTPDLHRDPVLEQILLEHGHATDPTPELVPLDRIDRDASHAAQVRDEAADPDTVDRYTAALEDGANFPAILVATSAVTPGGGPGTVVAGLHRLEAHLAAGRTEIWAYTIRTTPLEARLVSIESNARHGRPFTTDEQVRLGLELVDQGHTINDSARSVGIPPAKLIQANSVREATARAARLHCAKPWEKITAVTSRARLQSLADDGVFAATVEMVARLNLGGRHLADGISRLNKAPTISDQLRLLDDLEEEHDERTNRRRTGGGGGRPNHTGAARGAAFEILDLADHVDAVIAGCPNSDRARLANHTRRAGRILLQIAESLED